MATKKMNDLEWARYLEMKRRNQALTQKLKKSEAEIRKKEGKEDKKFNVDVFFKKYLLQSWVVGAVAALLMGFIFSWRNLLEHVLSWTIGVTIVTTFFATFSTNQNAGKKK